MTPPSRGARSADSEILRSYSEALRTLRTSGGRPLALRPNGKRQADGAAAGHLPRPGARRSARATPKCSEAAPKSHRAPSGGAPGRRGQAPRGRRHSLGRGPTRSDRGPTRSDRGPTRLVEAPVGSPAPRQVSPSIANSRPGRPARRDFAVTGRHSQVEGTAPGERRPPPKYRQVSRGPRTSRTGRWPPPAGRSRRELPRPLRRRGGCRAGRRRVKGPQNPSTAPARGAGGGSGRGPFRRLLDAPLPGAPRQAGRRQARLHPAGADTRKGRQS